MELILLQVVERAYELLKHTGHEALVREHVQESILASRTMRHSAIIQKSTNTNCDKQESVSGLKLRRWNREAERWTSLTSSRYLKARRMSTVNLAVFSTKWAAPPHGPPIILGASSQSALAEKLIENAMRRPGAPYTRRLYFPSFTRSTFTTVSSSSKSWRTAFETWRFLPGKETSWCRTCCSEIPVRRISIFLRILPD